MASRTAKVPLRGMDVGKKSCVRENLRGAAECLESGDPAWQGSEGEGRVG